MIIKAWKKNDEKIDIKLLGTKGYRTNISIEYLCDICGTLRKVGNIQLLFRTSKKNSLSKQLCKSCSINKHKITEKNGELGKVCGICKKWKIIDNYSKDRKCKDKLQWKCKECSNKKTNAWIKRKVIFNEYVNKISYAESIRHNPKNKELLQVKCTHCNKWFSPSKSAIQNRISALNGKVQGESRLYCSNKCKQECSIFGQEKYPKGIKPYNYRPLQKEWADMVKERDGHKCIKCGSAEELIAHHKEGILWEPLESADIDMGITLCKRCEKEVHSVEGCNYSDMRC